MGGGRQATKVACPHVASAPQISGVFYKEEPLPRSANAELAANTTDEVRALGSDSKPHCSQVG